MFTWTFVQWVNIMGWIPAAEGSSDFSSPFPPPVGTAGPRHMSMSQPLSSVFRCFLFVGRNSIPKLSALRIYYRLHPVGSNRETPDSNQPDSRPQDCLSLFRLSTVAVPCCCPWLESSGMGLWGNYYGLRGMRKQGSAEDYKMGSFMFCTLYHMLFGKTLCSIPLY